MEIAYKDSLKNIELIYHGGQELNKNIKLYKFGLSKGFYAGNNRIHPYLDILISRQIYCCLELKILFLKQIKNNIDKYINIKHFEKDRLFSIDFNYN